MTSPSPATLIITKLPFHAAEIGITYAPVALGASGGVPPYSWSIAAGSLPPGLALSSAGSASGKPTAVGTFAFTVRVEDSAGGAAGVPRTLTVSPRLAVSGLCTQQCSVEEGCVTVCGKFGNQSGGVAPYRYIVYSGGIPTGMGLRGLALTGAFSFPPPICDCSGWQFTVRVTDALGAIGDVDASYFIFTHITIDGASQSCASNGCTVGYFGGNSATPSVSITNPTCSPPCPGPVPFSGTASGGVVTISLLPGTRWAGSFDIAIADQNPCSPFGFCTSNTVTLVGNFDNT